MHTPECAGNDVENGLFRIEFHPKGAKPPVFIGGTFTDPPWQLLEMKSIESGSPGKYKFEIKLKIPKGRDYQYKFRLGEGDWWDLNEEEPTVVDAAGNRNNLLPTGSNRDGWKIKSVSDQGEQVLEERFLTKYTAEERKKTVEIPKMNFSEIHQPKDTQFTSALDLLSTDAKSKENQYYNEQQDSRQFTKIDVNELQKQLEVPLDTKSDTMMQGISAQAYIIPPTVNAEKPLELEEEYFSKLAQLNDSPSATKEIDVEQSEPVSSKLEHIDKEISLSTKLAADAISQKLNVEMATTAAEVADVAAILDQEPTPVSDTEAGRVGLRRLSSTPIEEVTRVAAEVADVAAILDQEPTPVSDTEAGRVGIRRLSSSSTEEVTVEVADVAATSDDEIEKPAEKTTRQLMDEEAEKLFGSEHTTPDEEKVPRFSYECPLFPDLDEPKPNYSENIVAPAVTIQDDQLKHIDFNDPSIQMFPTDRASIIAKIKEIQDRLPEDKAHFEGVSISSIALPEQRTSLNQSGTVSSRLHINQPSTSLQPITEEESIKEEILRANVPSIEISDSKSNSTSQTSKQEEIKTEQDIIVKDQNSEDSKKNDITKLEPPLTQKSEEEDLNSPSLHRQNSNTLALSSNNPSSGVKPLVTTSDNSCKNREEIIFSNKTEHLDREASPDRVSVDSNISSDHNEAISTGAKTNDAPLPTLRRPKSQTLKSRDRSKSQETEHTRSNYYQSRGFLGVIWRLLMVDWIGGFMKRLWNGRKRNN